MSRLWQPEKAGHQRKDAQRLMCVCVFMGGECRRAPDTCQARRLSLQLQALDYNRPALTPHTGNNNIMNSLLRVLVPALSLPLSSLLTGNALAQNFDAPAGWTMPRTEYGHPNLQGYWGNQTQTPMERPADLVDKPVYSEEEARALEQRLRDQLNGVVTVLDPDRPAPEAGARVGQEAEAENTDVEVGFTRINGEYRTSLVVDPADGRFPFRDDNGRTRDIYGQWRAQGFGEFDGPEIRPAGERCLSAIGTMPPMALLPYNSNVQIVQNKDYVMILGEMVHDARIIRLNGEHQPEHVKTWFGDSIGHWEGDTLVVHTTHFRPEISNFRIVSSGELQVDERYTLVNEREILYRYTVTDPQIYKQPYSVEMLLHRMEPNEKMYEFACHEGNYSMEIILRGARQQEHDERLRQAGTP